MKLGIKLLGSFILVALATLTVGFMGWFSVHRMSAHIETIGNDNLPSIESLLTIKQQMLAINVAQRTLLNPELAMEGRQRQYADITSAWEEYRRVREVYERLPRGGEEEQLWNRFISALDPWVRENDSFLALSRELEQTDVLNPMALRQKIEQFRGDYYQLQTQLLALIEAGSSGQWASEIFEGGEDHTQSALGRWMAEYTSENQRIRQVLSDIAEPNMAFHEAVGEIKTSIAARSLYIAKHIFQEQMVPSAEQIFQAFDILRNEAATVEELYLRMNQQAMVTVAERGAEVDRFLDDLIALNRQEAVYSQQTAASQAGRSKTVSLLGMVLSFGAALAFGFFLSTSITKTFRRVIERLTGTSEKLAGASHEVSQASRSLAEGSSQQAAGIEETSASQEMTAQAEELENLVHEIVFIVGGSSHALETDAAEEDLDETPLPDRRDMKRIGTGRSPARRLSAG